MEADHPSKSDPVGHPRLRVPSRRWTSAPPASYLTLAAGMPVYSSDGQRLGDVEHVLADPEKDIFDGIVFDASALPGRPPLRRRSRRRRDLRARRRAGARRRRRGQHLHKPGPNPATMSATPDDVTESELQRKLRRAWDMISGNY